MLINPTQTEPSFFQEMRLNSQTSLFLRLAQNQVVSMYNLDQTQNKVGRGLLQKPTSCNKGSYKCNKNVAWWDFLCNNLHFYLHNSSLKKPLVKARVKNECCIPVSRLFQRNFFFRLLLYEIKCIKILLPLFYIYFSLLKSSLQFKALLYQT